MPLGTAVKVEGPFGNFTLHNNAARTAVFLQVVLASRRSAAWFVVQRRNSSSHRIFLFFSNRRPEDAPFLEELQALERENPNYKFVATMTQMEKSRLALARQYRSN